MAVATPPTKKAPDAGAEPALYAETKIIHPRKVKGTFRNLKWYAMAILLAFWHLAPFLRWDRGPGAPDQAILVDLDGGRAYFFFIEIWPQEVYYLTGLLLIASMTLFLMSSLAGRVWCGFLCWQTVYTDLYVLVERLISGDRAQRMSLARAPWTADKLIKRGAINAIWILIALACGISFALFFGDAWPTLKAILTLDAGVGTYSAIGIVGGSCYILAGFGREQVCFYACPYARFQSAMFDEHSLIVSYEKWRGEPRAPARKNTDFSDRGHCIDCKMCVTSCPTGIDIREGSQMECIGCGLCIDACNTMMDKYGLPRGLISYDSNVNQELRAKGDKPVYKLVRPRTVVYAALITLIGCVMLYSLAFRKTTEVNILHERSPLYVQMSNGKIRNGYSFKILNMVRQERTYTVKLAGIDGATLDVVGGASGVTETDLTVAPDDVGTFRLYVSAPEAKIQGVRTPLFFIVTEKSEGRSIRSETLFAGPEK